MIYPAPHETAPDTSGEWTRDPLDRKRWVHPGGYTIRCGALGWFWFDLSGPVAGNVVSPCFSFDLAMLAAERSIREDFERAAHVVTSCFDCPAENGGGCLLADRDCNMGAPDNQLIACPLWCPLRKGLVALRLEPDE